MAFSAPTPGEASRRPETGNYFFFCDRGAIGTIMCT
jgi:hypothetical protein